MQNVLICDSDELFRSNLTSFLESKGFYIQEASRPSEAVKYVLKEKFNAIVFNLQSEDMNGIQIFSAIRAIDYILKPIWFLAFQKTKSWLQLYSGKIVFGFYPKTILRWV